jgi:hypothetical protein
MQQNSQMQQKMEAKKRENIENVPVTLFPPEALLELSDCPEVKPRNRNVQQARWINYTLAFHNTC